jgi:hypothetical protein
VLKAGIVRSNSPISSGCFTDFATFSLKNPGHFNLKMQFLAGIALTTFLSTALPFGRETLCSPAPLR